MGTYPIELVIGVIGAAVLIAAWLWETYENIKKHKMSIHLHFAVMYIFGNIMMALYAWMISNQIFFWLTAILLVAIMVELVYARFSGMQRRR